MCKFTEICVFNKKKKSKLQPRGPGTGPYAEGTKTRKTLSLYFLLGYSHVQSQQETDDNIWKRWRAHEIHFKEKFGELWKRCLLFTSFPVCCPPLLVYLFPFFPPSFPPFSLPSFPPSVYTSVSLSVCHFQSRKCWEELVWKSVLHFVFENVCAI